MIEKMWMERNINLPSTISSCKLSNLGVYIVAKHVCFLIDNKKEKRYN
jgi:hypothetical protein